MVVDVILNCVNALLSALLFPLDVLNWGIDVLTHISVVNTFLRVVFYVIPFNNLQPIIIFIFGMFIFRSVVSLIKTAWDLIPIL